MQIQLQDLIQLYVTKSDDDLLQLAADSSQLTSVARSALEGELARRRINVNANLIGEPQSAQGQADQPEISLEINQRPVATGELIAEVLLIYRGQFWLFIKLIAPAVIVGYFAVVLGQHESREILRRVPRGIEVVRHEGEIFEAGLANLSGFFISWLVFCYSFSTICSAVRQIEAGDLPSVSRSHAEIRERRGSLLRVAVVLFCLCLIAFGASILFSAGASWVASQFHARVGGFGIWISLAGIFLSFLVLSRFALSVPAVVLDDCRIRQAIFRSDELTEGKWLTLAALLAKSLIGGYLAAIAPFWLAWWTLGSISLPLWFPWVLTTVSIAAVTVVEPTMFIGFALLYTRMSACLPAKLPRKTASRPHPAPQLYL